MERKYSASSCASSDRQPSSKTSFAFRAILRGKGNGLAGGPVQGEEKPVRVFLFGHERDFFIVRYQFGVLCGSNNVCRW